VTVTSPVRKASDRVLSLNVAKAFWMRRSWCSSNGRKSTTATAGFDSTQGAYLQGSRTLIVVQGRQALPGRDSRQVGES
jgi:hypothetical protein